MDDELVEAVALRLLASKISRKASGYAHLRAGFAAPFPADYEDARAIIPLVQQAERADVVKWLRAVWLPEISDQVTPYAHRMAQYQAVESLADAIERGDHTSHCVLGPVHGCASTHTNKDGVRCCDFCGHPVAITALENRDD